MSTQGTHAHLKHPGKTEEPPSGTFTITHNTTFRLLSQATLLNLGHNVGLNIIFSSPSTLQDLRQRGTTGTGTMRSNRHHLPYVMQDTRVVNNEAAVC